MAKESTVSRKDFFKLKENKTTVRTEIVAGLTTFFTMAYIIFVNPSILGTTGMDTGAIMLATCISAAIGTLLMGLLSNYPLAQAPGMGLNAFFAFTICGTYGYSWQAGLAAVFISGLIFILLTATGGREAIVNAIPLPIKKAISGGIGLFIAIVALINAGIVANSDSTLITLGNFSDPKVLLAVIGIVITTVLVVWHVKGGLFISILITTVVGAIMQFGFGANVGIAKGLSVGNSLAPTFGQFLGGFGELLKLDQGIGVAIFSLISVLISLTMVDMFDTLGTLYGACAAGNMLTEDGNVPNMDKAMLADAVATCCGAVCGTSTVTTFVESSAGVAEGGRTGLASMATAALFFIAMFLAPVAQLIPTYACAAALIYVGVLMMSNVRSIDWDDPAAAVPGFMTVAFMPLTYNISYGIAFGLISYVFIKIFTGKIKEVNAGTWVITILFALMFFLTR